MPSYRTGKQDENGKDLYKDICYSVKRDFTKTLNEMIINKYKEEAERKTEEMVDELLKDRKKEKETEKAMVR
jgi:DNA-binding cell septation regulator SpoVG